VSVPGKVPPATLVRGAEVFASRAERAERLVIRRGEIACFERQFLDFGNAINGKREDYIRQLHDLRDYHREPGKPHGHRHVSSHLPQVGP
jgi:hypothetical protein